MNPHHLTLTVQRGVPPSSQLKASSPSPSQSEGIGAQQMERINGSYYNRNKKSKSKSTMICTWIAELMLHRIVALEFFSTAPTADVTKTITTTTTTTTSPLKVKAGQHQHQLQQGIESQHGSEAQGRTGEGARLAALLAFKEFLRKYKCVTMYYIALLCTNCDMPPLVPLLLHLITLPPSKIAIVWCIENMLGVISSCPSIVI